MAKVVPLFIEDEFTGLQVPNVRQRMVPLYALATHGGCIKVTEQRGQAIGWLAEAISKTEDPTEFWIEVL